MMVLDSFHQDSNLMHLLGEEHMDAGVLYLVKANRTHWTGMIRANGFFSLT